MDLDTCFFLHLANSIINFKYNKWSLIEQIVEL